MKIHGSDGTSGIQSILQRLQQGEAVGQERQTEPSSSSASEKVEISPQGREIQRIKALLDEIPDVRDKKVEEIRSLIQEGRYQVDPNLVTDKILQSLIVGDF
jgi:flagellar biosynthesis anti-sigma factor FlgM